MGYTKMQTYKIAKECFSLNNVSNVTIGGRRC